MTRPKTYHISLTENEVVTLRKVIKDKKTVLKRCQILLELDETQGSGLTHSQIAHTYAVRPSTITNTVQSYVKLLNITLAQTQVQHYARQMGGKWILNIPAMVHTEWKIKYHVPGCRKGRPCNGQPQCTHTCIVI